MLILQHKTMLWGRRHMAAALFVAMILTLSGCSTGGSARAQGRPFGNLQENVQLDTIIPLTYPIGAINRVIVAGDAGATYIYTDQDWASAGKIILLRVHGPEGRADTVVLNVPRDSALDRRGSLADIAVDKDHIALLFWKALVVFKRSGGSFTVGPPIVVPLNYPYKQVGLINGRCYAAMCNLSAREYGDHYTFAIEVNPSSGKVEWEQPLPDPDGFQFTPFIPRRIIEFMDNGILVGDLTRYRIMLYDSLGRPLSMLERHIPDWEKQYDSSFRRYRPLTGRVPYNMKGLLDTLRPYLSRMYMIRLVDAVDDSTILVAWQSPHKHALGRLKGLEKVYFDTWRRRGMSWELHATDLPDFNPLLTDSFAVNRMVPLLWEYWSIGDSRIVVLDPLPPMNLQSKTYGDIRNAVDSTIVVGEPPFSLIRFKVSP